jgi:hypothetical protein
VAKAVANMADTPLLRQRVGSASSS